MPYIKKNRREVFDELPITALKIDSAGELNYVITMICLHYLNKYGLKKYERLNEIIGALECAKFEFYRKQIADYEDLKEKENGSLI